jgi:uncharacterized membrane protein (DUF106 family)
MTSPVIADQIAAIDRQLQKLQKRHAEAHRTADLAAINKLQDEISHLTKEKERLQKPIFDGA